MKQILINTESLTLATRDELNALGRNGCPLQRAEAGEWNVPDGYAYVDNHDRPDAVDGMRWVRETTLDGHGWTQEELPPQELYIEPIEKRTVIERLEAIGKRNDFKAFLRNLDELDQDIWDAVSSIRADDPFILKNIEAFKVGFGMTDEEITTLLTP